MYTIEQMKEILHKSNFDDFKKTGTNVRALYQLDHLLRSMRSRAGSMIRKLLIFV